MVAFVTLGYFSALGTKLLYGEINWVKASHYSLNMDQPPNACSCRAHNVCMALLYRARKFENPAGQWFREVGNTLPVAVLHTRRAEESTTPVLLALHDPTEH